ncbi:hypothetical protein BGW38_001257, partial [Lunasporangiospora selenospora]
TFNVIGYPSVTSGSFGVSIGGTVTKLATTEDTFPVWSGAVRGTTSSVNYQYVELDATGAAIKSENFTRALHKPDATHSYNEFFQRQTTKYVLPHIPYTYLATWPSNTKAFNDDEIATLHLTTDPTQLAQLHSDPMIPVQVRVNFRFISHDTVHSQKNITFQTSGKSSKAFKKQSYKVSFDTDYNQTFFGRPNIKLRAEATDPTMIRERLYIDMLNAVGVPTQQGSYVRLFLNNEFYGLYLMVDDIKKSFIKQTVYGGDATKALGSLLQMNAPTVENSADLTYKGNNGSAYDPEVYAVQNLGANPPDAPLTQLIQFMADLQAFDPISTPDPIAYWNNTRLDLDGFLRNMAMEYLAGAWDNYWFSGSNYFFYFNPTLGAKGKWQWLPTDFDGTFGDGFPTSVLSRYQAYYDFKIDHPLVSKLILNNTQINGLFEQTLREIVGWSFKPEALHARIMTYNQMISDDVRWDYSLVRTGPGNTNNYTIEDFNANLDTIIKDMSYSLKGWITDMSTLVTTQLNFAVQPGLADRVAPPPKPTKNSDKKGDKKGSGSRTSASLLGMTTLVVIASVFMTLLTF